MEEDWPEVKRFSKNRWKETVPGRKPHWKKTDGGGGEGRCTTERRVVEENCVKVLFLSSPNYDAITNCGIMTHVNYIPEHGALACGL